MGFIKSGIVIFLSVVLFLSLFLGNSFLTLSWSLEYETVSPNLASFANSFIDDVGVLEILTNNYGVMEVYCLSNSNFPLNQDDFNLEIPCDVINQGVGDVISYGIDAFVSQIYYKNYDCSFWECLKVENTPYVLVSEKARVYWKSLFYWALLLSCVLFVLLFLFTDSKNSPLTIAGILMIIAALPFRKLNWVMSFIPDSSLFDLATVFLSRAYNVFLIMVIIGIILFAVGIAFHFFGFGMKISNFISWLFNKKEKKGEIPLNEEGKEKFTKEEVKDIVKEEVANSKKKENLRDHVKDLVKEEINKV